MDHVIELADAEAFQRCRRAWDLGAAARQNFEPVEPLRPVDVGRAVRDGLAAWYFPAMRGWDRSLVRPIAMEAFHKSMRAQHADASATERCVADTYAALRHNVQFKPSKRPPLRTSAGT